jgi:hypothetical protein
MAERPIFVPNYEGPNLVSEIVFSFAWHGGFAASQKMKNRDALHAAARAKNYCDLLETSSKSGAKVGRHLSAFHLKLEFKGREIPIECLFQGSKVFEGGGPYTELYDGTPLEAKKDTRLRQSGKLLHFEYLGKRYPTFPASVFYDWLFISAMYRHKEWLGDRLARFDGFTDIEFNPNKSLNCQARSCAIFMSLLKRGILDKSLESFESFRNIHMGNLPDQHARAENYDMLVRLGE